MAMAEGGAGAPSASPTCRRCCGGGCGLGLGLGRLVRRLRRQALLCAPSSSSSAAAARLRGCQYDPLSYARNFDAPDDCDDSGAAQLYYSYTFSSRFVLAPASSAAAAAPTRGH